MQNPKPCSTVFRRYELKWKTHGGIHFLNLYWTDHTSHNTWRLPIRQACLLRFSALFMIWERNICRVVSTRDSSKSAHINIKEHSQLFTVFCHILIYEDLLSPLLLTTILSYTLATLQQFRVQNLPEQIRNSIFVFNCPSWSHNILLQLVLKHS